MAPGPPSSLNIGSLMLPLDPLLPCLWDLWESLDLLDIIDPEEVLELSLRESPDSSGLGDKSRRLFFSSFMAFLYSFSHSHPCLITSSQWLGCKLPLRLLYKLLLLFLSLWGLV